MQLADFDYHLPAELIAQAPLADRAASRLLDMTAAAPRHRIFTALPQLLAPGDLLVVNNTQVVKARLHGHKDSGGAAEILLERITAPRTALCQVRVSKSLAVGRTLAVAGQPLTVLGRDGQFYHLEFPTDVVDFLECFGELPLPPYIDPQATSTAHESRYQTVYAAVPGVVAAPTAGLHFTPELLATLAAAGVNHASVTLHVGAGTFQPVRTSDLSLHQMHSEHYTVPAATIDAVRACGGRVVAVGTTVVRALEAAAAAGALARPSGANAHTGATDLFITPGYEFRVVDVLITNFHLPRSTLLMLVCAFAGFETVMAAYDLAVRERYRFFSYGDAMCLRRVAATDKEM